MRERNATHGWEKHAQLLAQAFALYRSGKAEEGARHCRDVLQSDPNNVKALHLLAVIRHASGKYDEAFRHLERAMKLAPDSAELRRHCIQTAASANRHQTALRHTDELLKRWPEALDVQIERARLLDKIGRPADAVHWLEDLDARLPGNINVLAPLSSLLKQSGRLEDAEKVCRRAIAVARTEAGLHNNLGNVLGLLERHTEAVDCYQRAIELNPRFTAAYSNLGETLVTLGDHGKALSAFDQCKTRYGESRALVSLAHLKRWDEFDARMRTYAETDPINLRKASISAYCAERRSMPDPYNFCPDPLGEVRIDPRDAADISVDRLKRAIKEQNAVWEPSGKTTTGGFQSTGNLFATPCPVLGKLESHIRKCAERYRAERADHTSDLVVQWPDSYRLQAWYVELRSGGFQAPHIHPEGWVSGVVYLNVPDTGDAAEEGAIEFTLRGDTFPEPANRPHPTVRHKPTPGDVVLFPSSLYHRTLPFDSKDSRICIAFDMVPER